MKKFLSLPLKQGTTFKITEGWLYSPQERSIHGRKKHYGIDFASERGSPVLAAADGYAISSYHTKVSGKWRGKLIGLGLGHFVQIWHPEYKVFTCYGHLSKIEKRIPYFKPVQTYEGAYVSWQPTIYEPIEKLVKKSKFVKRGEVIGYMGDSGLCWGYSESPVHRPNPNKYPSWDEVHLHFEVYQRDKEGRKVKWFDPFGLNKNHKYYQKLKSSPKGLWLLDKNKKPIFAKDR